MRKSWEAPMHSCKHEIAKSGKWFVFDTECGMRVLLDDEHELVRVLDGYHCPWCGGLLNREEVLDALGRFDD